MKKKEKESASITEWVLDGKILVESGRILCKEKPRSRPITLTKENFKDSLLLNRIISASSELEHVTFAEFVECVLSTLSNNAQTTDEIPDDLPDLKTFLENVCADAERDKKFRITETGIFGRVEGGQSSTWEVARDCVALAVGDYNKDLRKTYGSKATPHMFDQNMVTPALNVMLNERKDVLVTTTRERLAYVPHAKQSPDEAFYDHALPLVTAMSAPKTELEKYLDVLAIQQLLWQFMRKLHGREPSEHIALFFDGTQGCGKSETVKKLVSAASEALVVRTSLDEMQDRGVQEAALASRWLILEETRSLWKKTLDSFKNFITEPYKDNRAMYDRNTTPKQNRTTVIGTTNIPISDILGDPSGARRFYSFQGPLEVGARMDFDVINSFDFTRLYTLIDPEDPRAPLTRNSNIYNLFRDKQAATVRKSTLDLFLIEYKTYLKTNEMDITPEDVELKPYLDAFKKMKDVGIEFSDPAQWKPPWPNPGMLIYAAYQGPAGQSRPGYARCMGSTDKKISYHKFEDLFYRAVCSNHRNHFLSGNKDKDIHIPKIFEDSDF